VDVYEPGPGSQIHDLNPSEFPPTGLFWTVPIPENGVQVHPGNGYASMEARNVAILDYGNLGNALFGGGAAPIPGQVSFRVVWNGVIDRVTIRNTDPVYGGFGGSFVYNTAQMEWTGRVGDYAFVSGPLASSDSGFALLGHERNGSFFE
jgi:hypothetical protein